MTDFLFQDFPKNIPQTLHNNAWASMTKWITELASNEERIELIKDEKNPNKVIKRYWLEYDDLKEEDEFQRKYTVYFLDILTCCAGRKEPHFEKALNFGRLLLYQSFIMHFSNFEGILADSLRSVCVLRPEVLKKDKTVKVDEIFSVKSHQELVKLLVEKSVKELGYQNLEEKVETFEKLLGLKINLNTQEKLALRKVELIRNLIVHNAGKVNSDYLKLNPKIAIQVGDNVPLTEGYLEEISWVLQDIATKIFLQISMKHFKKKYYEATENITLPSERT